MIIFRPSTETRAGGPRFRAHDHRLEPQADRRQCIVDMRRHDGMDRTRHQPRLLQLPQLLGQHPLGDRLQLSLQLAKAVRTGQEMEEDHALPLAVEEIEGGLDRAPGEILRQLGAGTGHEPAFPGRRPARHGILYVPTDRKCAFLRDREIMRICRLDNIRRSRICVQSPTKNPRTSVPRRR